MLNERQKKAILTEDKNILVSASAGSGKTMVLVERILHKIIQEKAHINELIVVTFTDMAAKEMKERLETRLKELVNETHDYQLQKRLLKEIDLLPQAHIQTLHSFCLFVLQNYFHVLDIDPSFTLLTDEVKLYTIYQEAWHNVCHKLLQNQLEITQEEYESFFNQFSNTFSDEVIFDMVFDIYQFSRSHPESQLWLSHLSDISQNPDEIFTMDLYDKFVTQRLHSMLNLAKDKLEHIWKESEQFQEKNREKYQSVLNQDITLIKGLELHLQENNFQAMTTYIQDMKFSSWPPNRRSSNPDDYEIINEAKALRDEAIKPFKDERKTLFIYSEETYRQMEAKNAENISIVSVLVHQFTHEVEEIKSDLNVLDYNDLEHLTLDILAPFNKTIQTRQKSEIAIEFQENIHELLIDEYQDINEIQASILYWLSRETHPQLANNLFMVGDVKQSIYGFRMAEPSLFLEKYQAYQDSEKNELIILDQNYRSKNEVLQFTNFIFERLMDKDFGEMTYGKNESLKFGNKPLRTPENTETFHVELMLHDKEDIQNDSEIDKSIEAEAHIIAQKIEKLIHQPFMIYDKSYSQKGNSYRPIEYKDIAILTATKKPFLTIQQVFKKYDIPMFTQKIENYYQRYEVQLVLSLLQIIDNPFQDIPLVAVLRSFIVGLSDNDLAKIRIHQKDGSFYYAVLNYLHVFKETDGNDGSSKEMVQKLHYFLDKLNYWRDISSRISVMELILIIYDNTQILNHFSTMTNSDQRLANLHGLYEQAKKFEKESYQGLFSFINYIIKMLENEKDIAEPQLFAEDQNFVKVMTVHSSKGLEFPLVFLMDTGKQFNLQDSQSSYIAHRKYGISTKIFDKNLNRSFKPLTYHLYRQDLIHRTKAEEMRKLYVALTRCEQKLLIVGTVSQEEAAYKWIQEVKETRFPTNDLSLHLNLQVREKSKSWLDWILGSLGKIDSHNLSITEDFNVEDVSLTFIKTEEIAKYMPKTQPLTTSSSKQSSQIRDDFINELSEKNDEYQDIQAKYYWNKTYPFFFASRTSSYQSVSELKRMYEEPHNPKLSHYADRRQRLTIEDDDKNHTEIQAIRYTQDTFNPPNFIQATQESEAIRRGNVNHLLLQNLDFSDISSLEVKEYSDYIKKSIDNLENEKKITPQDARLIEVEKIVCFLNSELGKLIQNYNHLVHKEQAFSYRLPASRMFEELLTYERKTELASDHLLVHGVIDNFIVTDRDVYLIDYKTDRYKPFARLNKDDQIQAIHEKYRFQLQIYADALATIYPKKHIKAWLVLLDFQENIRLF